MKNGGTQWGQFNAFNQLTHNYCPYTSACADTTYSYDPNGNLLTKTVAAFNGMPQQVTGYAWDRDNRLTQVNLPNGTTNSFAYDANGLRVQRVDSTGTARYVLDHNSVADELDDAGNVRTSYLTNPQAIDEVLSFQQGGATYYPLTDALGSIYAIADSGGHVVRTNSYEVYGARTSSGAGPQIAFGFTGREHDPDTGLNYNRDRYLNPLTGDWIQADRKGFIDGPNVFMYAGEDPVSHFDPDGFSEIEKLRIISAFDTFLVQETKAGHRFDAPGSMIDVMAGLTAADSVVERLASFGYLDPTRVHACGEQAADLLGYLSGNVSFVDYKLRFNPVDGWDGFAGSAHQWDLAASKKDNSVLLLDPFFGQIWERSYYPEWSSEGGSGFMNLQNRPFYPEIGDEEWSRIYRFAN